MDPSFKKDRFSCGWLAKAPQLLEECQKGLVLHLAERIWKMADVHWVIRCGELLHETMTDAAVVDVADIDLASGQLRDG
eukprot:5730854-Pyramimonas_sp.AAC.1